MPRCSPDGSAGRNRLKYLVMKEQRYDNHIRYYPPHHFIFYPAALILLGGSIYMLIREPSSAWLWISQILLWVMLIWLSFMMRQHYSLTLQNRIVRLELRFRYFTLTHQRFEPLEQRLSFRQLAALRFASDEELPSLVEKTLEEKLSPGQIKRSIKNWNPDDMRV